MSLHAPEPDSSSQPKETNSRDALVRAALHLIVTQGYHRTTTDQIARTAGVAAGTLYVHFKSKESLALEVFRRCAESASVGMFDGLAKAQTTAERVRAMITYVFDWCEKHSEEAIYLFLLRHSEMFKDTKRVGRVEAPLNPGNLMEEVIRQGQQSGEIRRGEFRALRMVGGIALAFIGERLEGWHERDLRDDVDMATKMCCAALGIDLDLPASDPPSRSGQDGLAQTSDDTDSIP